MRENHWLKIEIAIATIKTLKAHVVNLINQPMKYFYLCFRFLYIEKNIKNKI